MKLEITLAVIGILYFISVAFGLMSGQMAPQAAIIQSGICLLFIGLAIWRNRVMANRRK